MPAQVCARAWHRAVPVHSEVPRVVVEGLGLKQACREKAVGHHNMGRQLQGFPYDSKLNLSSETVIQ